MIEHMRPADIERTSMAIIAAELKQRNIVLEEETSAVVKRVIHTTADFEYADTLTFTEGAVTKGIAALRQGVSIVTDTNMALSGINKTALKKLGGEAKCYMADMDVAQAAKERGVTRAVISMERAAEEHPGAILAVGNAPTALIRIAQLMEEGLRPALVIGVPVGFVNVVESKELVLETCRCFQVPAIVALGRKGGSNVAAAMVNALLYSAVGAEDPERRQP